MTVAYEGTLFLGWQIQVKSPTVQGEIERVLATMHHRKVNIVSAGRTDRGVSAMGQVFHFDSELNIPLDRWPLALNALLPDGIRILETERVSDDFHARYDARMKHYLYRIETGDYDLFSRNTTLQLNRPLNVAAMRQGASILVGTHDFTSFNSSPLSVVPNQIRTLFKVEIEEVDSKVLIHYYGDGFLRHMLRMITQTLIEVGAGRISSDEIYELLEAKHKEAVIYNAPPQGLMLVKVYYDKERIT